MFPIILALVLTAPLDDKRVSNFFSDVLHRSVIWGDFSETAAFLVADSKGDVQCLLWPQTNEYKKQTFIGSMPHGTIAIVHTHPDYMPQPSEHDIAAARAISVPIFVITRSRVTLIEPTMSRPFEVVKNRYWSTRRIEEKCVSGWVAR